MTALFQRVGEDWKSNAGMLGRDLRFKIECDALNDESVAVWASEIARKLSFRDVYGIPTGGNRLVQALQEHRSRDGGLLIVDDVLTTGGSMEKARSSFRLDDYGGYALEDIRGAVIFARCKPADWISAFLTLGVIG